ncbi:ABC transporter permease [Sphingomonas sp. BK345]|uniref:ABC transporter permease n=1 Tax=Sphingomonas sp. BK345 TaxID=2586980 RepID=UPI00161BA222|nr:ABC transporter permease [Sphingomonas sp. BK345]MBB3472950.1 putative ABC transport system permease protein [Sphingomonas sp. BK345]
MLGTTVLLAARSIRRHALRSFLTVLGIVIGVAAVVTMVTLGDATSASVQKQIANLGTNLLHVHPGQGARRGGGGPPPASFDPDDVVAIERQVSGVTGVAPQAQTTSAVFYEGNNWSTSIFGMDATYFVIQPWPLQAGRVFTPAEESAGKAVCVIGSTVSKNLFKELDPIGRRFRAGPVSCEVIGLFTTKGQGQFGDQDDLVIMPIKTVARRFLGTRDIKALLVGVDPAYDTEQVKASLTGLLRERRHVEAGEDDDFLIIDTRQISETLSGTTAALTRIVAAVAAISLVVGGIGIMNVMLVAVTERTREIGIRLAIGAVAREVLLQFLVEAVTLSCLGGLAGLLLAQVAIAGLSRLMSLDWSFNPAINALAFGFSGIIGIVFGFVPARRAAGLDPIDALRHE